MVRVRKKVKKEEKKEKGITKTIESCREENEDVPMGDEEDLIEQEIENNKIGNILSKSSKIMLTTTIGPSKKLKRFCVDLSKVFPNTKFINRRKFTMKVMIKAAIKNDFTSIMLIADNGLPDCLTIIQLPHGPTICFKLSNVITRYENKKNGELSNHYPELILNNFSTKVGQTIGKTFSLLFPPKPDFDGRRVITFHTQRDYIFFRHHRYVLSLFCSVSLKFKIL
ncbi:Ribosome production factor 1 [Intoshia linei]|uniref:Ribosome production factor 1 n=1 Tax=Intoshia linei TaxID=1819745 RepID=A0A177B6R6_9BILA|nr:Ribosome production factor 1 [Intoshia linei]